MKMYFVKTPWLLRKMYPSFTWKIATGEKVIYLSFDDGPHPVVTPFVLDLLKKYKAKASFFCIGKNVLEHPIVYGRIIEEGHTVGNHTYKHLNGWKTEDDMYVADVARAAGAIHADIFRPPYGRIKRSQALKLNRLKIIMWDVLSGDFDVSLTGDKCFRNIVNNAGNGSIVVMHDSEKAFPRLQLFLPELLKYYTGKGYRMEALQFS